MLRKKYIFKISVAFLFSSIFFLQLNAQRWDIPADKKAKNSYIRFDNNTAKEGEAVYNKNCKSCHGDPAQGNGIKTLNPIPPDLASSLAQELTDGELFYILNIGRNAMPSFKNTLSEEERWKVISFIRSFNNKYVQIVSKTDPNKSKLLKVKMNYDSLAHRISIDVVADEKSAMIPIKDAEISLFVNRYFGRLQIEKTQRTNNDGITFFNFPQDLPGDSSGNLDIIVKVNDEVYGEIESISRLKIGIPNHKPGLTEKRAIWNVLRMAPWWIIITYTSIMLAVSSIFLLIFINLIKIKKAGEN